jgi:hypothetical protein
MRAEQGIFFCARRHPRPDTELWMGKAGFCAACWSPEKARCLQCGCYSDGSRIGGGVGTGRLAGSSNRFSATERDQSRIVGR